MLQIIKANPSDDKLIYFLYGFLQSICADYKLLKFDDFSRCRNGIYIVVDLSHKLNNIIALIGCRRLTMEEAQIKELEYYCQPNELMYEIEFLHYDNSCTSYNRPDYEKSVISQLIKECAADKNDGFILYRPHCPSNETCKFDDILANNGFKQITVDDELAYIRKPITQK